MTHFIELLLVLKCFQQPEFQNERHFYALPRLNTSPRARKYNLLITFKPKKKARAILHEGGLLLPLKQQHTLGI